MINFMQKVNKIPKNSSHCVSSFIHKIELYTLSKMTIMQTSALDWGSSINHVVKFSGIFQSLRGYFYKIRLM